MGSRHTYKDIVTKGHARAHYGDIYAQGPVTIFKAADSATILVEALGKTLNTAYEVRCTADLDFILPNIVSQLTVWRAALTKIQEWAEIQSEGEYCHHNVLHRLGSMLTSCQILASRVDDVVSNLQRLSTLVGPVTENEEINSAVAEMRKLQKSIKVQTNTLNLLLTACNT